MGRNEIRLRRQRVGLRGIERFRNYNSVLKRHEDNQRIKKVMRVFGLFAVLLIVIMLIIFLSRWEGRSQSNSNNNSKQNGLALTQSLDNAKCSDDNILLPQDFNP